MGKLSEREKQWAMEAIKFLTEKKSGEIKESVVYNGKPTCGWLTKEEARRPTATLESITITAMIDAHEHCDVMTTDVPNAFTQMRITRKNVMKITGLLVDMLTTLNSTENTKKSPLCGGTKSNLRYGAGGHTVVQEIPEGYERSGIHL